MRIETMGTYHGQSTDFDQRARKCMDDPDHGKKPVNQSAMPVPVVFE
jgi:hypothetical protein